MLIGYARVSAIHQNLDRQLAMLKAEGCGRIFKEKLSGREGVRRPQLDKAIEALGTGDILVLAEWDRVTRSMLDGIWQRAPLQHWRPRMLPRPSPSSLLRLTR
jgi:DNA invertase Pin-like site-specific DNA recombinase